MRELHWSKRAIEKYNRQMFWYKVHDMNAASVTFQQNIQDTVALIQAMPDIGKLEDQTSSRTYRSFLSHPLCRIYYWYDNHILFIANLQFSKTE